MSGWQRLGVVISVLWLVGAPIYFVADMNQTAFRVLGMCYSAGSSSDQTDFDRTQREATCNAQLEEMTWSTQKLFNTLFTYNKDRGVLWAMLLVPLVIFWLFEAVIIGTVRWVRRGFRRSTA
jgi:hypothetical protein